MCVAFFFFFSFFFFFLLLLLLGPSALLPRMHRSLRLIVQPYIFNTDTAALCL
jgi:hypothetical protein